MQCSFLVLFGPLSSRSISLANSSRFRSIVSESTPIVFLHFSILITSSRKNLIILSTQSKNRRQNELNGDAYFFVIDTGCRSADICSSKSRPGKNYVFVRCCRHLSVFHQRKRLRVFREGSSCDNMH